MKLCAGLLAALLAVPAAAAPRFEVGLVEPEAGAPVFGQIAMAAEVRGGDAARVEFFLDGRAVGELLHPPWRIEVDAGEENLERRFKVVAWSAAGERAEAELTIPPVQVDEVVELPLQQIYVTAAHGGEPVLDLERRDFQVVERGTDQTLVTFERGDVPLTAILLLDSSASMRGGPLAAALAGARAFAAGMAPLDEAELVLFSDQVIAQSAFGSDPEALVAGLSGAEARGGSAIHDHLLLSLLELERRQGRRVVILLSDGVDVDSVLGTAELEAVAGRSPALLYWIRLGHEAAGARFRSVWRDFAGHAAELAGLERLVTMSGGRVLDIARPEQAQEAFGEILAELRRQYVLSWYPRGLRHDGSWRPIRIEVDRPGVELRAREGYFDD